MQNDNRIGEECGVFAIYDPDGDCARTTYYGLYALQHRGQESCGIAVNNNRDITHYKDMGLVNDVFNDEILTKLDGKMAVGHVRYSTTGESMRENAQPLVLRYVKGNIAIAHNGNLVNKDELAQELSVTGAIFQTTTDTEMIAYTIAKERLNSKSVEEAVEKTINHLVGAFSLIVMSPQKLLPLVTLGVSDRSVWVKRATLLFSPRKLVHLTVWVRNLSATLSRVKLLSFKTVKFPLSELTSANSHIQCVSLNTYILHVLTVLLKDSLHTIHVCLQANT